MHSRLSEDEVRPSEDPEHAGMKSGQLPQREAYIAHSALRVGAAVICILAGQGGTRFDPVRSTRDSRCRCAFLLGEKGTTQMDSSSMRRVHIIWTREYFANWGLEKRRARTAAHGIGSQTAG